MNLKFDTATSPFKKNYDIGIFLKSSRQVTFDHLKIDMEFARMVTWDTGISGEKKRHSTLGTPVKSPTGLTHRLGPCQPPLSQTPHFAACAPEVCRHRRRLAPGSRRRWRGVCAGATGTPAADTRWRCDTAGGRRGRG